MAHFKGVSALHILFVETTDLGNVKTSHLPIMLHFKTLRTVFNFKITWYYGEKIFFLKQAHGLIIVKPRYGPRLIQTKQGVQTLSSIFIAVCRSPRRVKIFVNFLRPNKTFIIHSISEELKVDYDRYLYILVLHTVFRRTNYVFRLVYSIRELKQWLKLYEKLI